MNTRYNEWNNNSAIWRNNLETALDRTSHTDIAIQYEYVAFSFPGGPHSRSFDHPEIDRDRFIPWAESKGWKVDLVIDEVSKAMGLLPQIRFIKQAA